MNENQNTIDILKSIPIHVQAIYSECVLYLSNEPILATEVRKTSIKNEISFLKEKIANLEKIID
jgi:hypothetical protein